jgi:hypothetical protein
MLKRLAFWFSLVAFATLLSGALAEGLLGVVWQNPFDNRLTDYEGFVKLSITNQRSRFMIKGLYEGATESPVPCSLRSRTNSRGRSPAREVR